MMNEYWFSRLEDQDEHHFAAELRAALPSKMRALVTERLTKIRYEMQSFAVLSWHRTYDQDQRYTKLERLEEILSAILR